MEDLQAKHRKEQRDLQARITQKRKAATKKTRKGINDECERLQRDMGDRHKTEINALHGLTEPNESEILDNSGTEDEKSVDDRSMISKDSIATGKNPSVMSQSQKHDPLPQHQPWIRKTNRQKARLARRTAAQEALAAGAAEEAAQLPDLREQERAKMVKEFKKLDLSEHEVRPDGHCLYSAIADQIEQLGLPVLPSEIRKGLSYDIDVIDIPNHKIVRQVAASYMSMHSEDFEPFLDEPLNNYIHKLRDTGEWGGHVELLALAKAYDITINVIQGDGKVEKVEAESNLENKIAWLAYYRHGFGLGEHYNSLRYT